MAAVESSTTTQDVLLLQFVKRYGNDDITKVLTGLKSNPLVQGEVGSWTEEQCTTRIKEIETREGLTVAKDMAQLFTRLRANRIQSLKETIRQDEARYHELKKIIANGADENTQEEDSTIADVSNAEAITKVASPVKASSLEDTSMIEAHEAVIEDEAMPDAEKSETAEEVDESAIVDAVESPVKQPTEEENSPASVPTKEPTPVPTPTKEPVPIPAKIEKVEPALHKTRSRSNTLNTVPSIDESAADDTETIEPTPKRRPGRPRTKRRQGTESPQAPKVRRDRTPPDLTPDQAAALKRFQSTIIPVINNISSHKYGSIFSTPVSDKDAPDYSKMVKMPTDLRTIRAQVKSGEISDSTQFHKAILRMLSNAVMYNPEQSGITTMARELYESCEVYIEMYKSAENEVDGSDDEEEGTPSTKRRRRG